MALLFIQAGTAAAVSVQPGQENIELAVENGKSHSFFLIVNSPSRETLDSSSPWVKIEGGESFILPSGGVAYLLITASVPEGTGPSENIAEIRYGTAVLSRIRITSILSLEEVLELKSLADVNSRIRSLESSINSTASSREDKARLEGEKAELRSQVNDLKEEFSLARERSEAERLEYTGNLAKTTSPVLLALGLLIGGSGTYLLSRKLHKRDGKGEVRNPGPG